MKFDIIIGNPPFNKVSGDQKTNKHDNNVTQIAGKTDLYKDFTIKAFDYLKSDGKLCFVVLKNIYPKFYTDKILKTKHVDIINFMDIKHWVYNTLHFVMTNIKRYEQPLITNPLYNKLFDPLNIFSPSPVGDNKEKYNKAYPFKPEGPNYEVIIDTPGRAPKKDPNQCTTALFSTRGRYDGKPKLIYTILASMASVTVDLRGIIGTHVECILCDSIEEANNLKILAKSKLMRFLIKDLNVNRGHYDVFRFLKRIPINTSEVLTDEKIYALYNLTGAEVKLIESVIK